MIRLLLGLAATMCAAGVANANPRALPFTYTTDTLAPGNVELEQFGDLVYNRAADINGNDHVFLNQEYQTEIEIGLADRLELGLYYVYVPALSDQVSPNGKARMPDATGVKQRLRYILADTGAWPVDVGIYAELVENAREVELEGKLLLQRRFDRVRVAVNVSAEYERYFDDTKEIVLNPSAGITYEVSPKLHIGVDSFMRGEYPDPKPATRVFGLGPEYYVGPAVMYNFGKIWWSVGGYARVSDTSHKVTDGELYGPVWFRTMIGYDIQ